MGTVSGASYASAHVTGEVDPNEAPGEYFWQVSTDGIHWNRAEARGEFGGDGFQSVEGDLKVHGGTTYKVRLGAYNYFDFKEVFSTAPYPEFTTLAVTPPTVNSLDPASGLTYTTAKVAGVVERPSTQVGNPAFDAECRFEYVSDAQYQPLNDKQELTVVASGGTYELVFLDEGTLQKETTSPIFYKASAAAVQAELAALTHIGTGNVKVTGGPGDKKGSTPYVITFQGALANQDIHQLEVRPQGLKQVGAANAGVATSVEGRPEGFNSPGVVLCPESPIKATGATPVNGEITNLRPNTTYHVRLLAENAGGVDTIAETFKTVFAPPPTATMTSATNPTVTTVDAAGTVNPNGIKTSAYFEYSPDGGTNWGLFPANLNFFCGFPHCPEPIPVEMGAGSSAVPLAKTIEGLEQPSTNYLVRIHAFNEVGEEATSNAISFKTKAVAPKAQTLTAGEVTPEHANLIGRVNPVNAAVTYQFEWGAVQEPGDSTYENKSPLTPQPLGGALDSEFHLVSSQITGLAPETEYHYRLVAVNTETSVSDAGEDRVFTTPATPEPPSGTCPNQSSRTGFSENLPDCRVYEFASPGLNGASIGPPNGIAGPDGDGVAYQIIDAPLDAEGSTVFGWAVSKRGANGWHTESVMPSVKESINGFNSSGVIMVSRDLKHSLVFTSQPIAGPGSPEGNSSYIRDNETRKFTATWNKGNPFFPGCCFPIENGAEASPDFSHVFYHSLENRLGSGPNATWEWSDGEVRAVGIMPATGKVNPEGANLIGGIERTGRVLGPFSHDGEEVVFGANGVPGIFLQVEHKESFEVTKTKRTVDEDPNPNEGEISYGVSADGSKVIFTSRSELTNDANTGETEGVRNHLGADLYLYERAGGKLTDLTVDNLPADAKTGAAVTGVFAASEDASYIYFMATGKLAPGARSGEENFYVWHNGKIDFITPAAGLGVVDLTPDGRTLAIGSTKSLTGYNNAGFGMIYKYTYGGSLECASCRPDGTPPTSDAGGASLGGRSLSDDGKRLFFASRDAAVPTVKNKGRSNVFEYADGTVHLISPGVGSDDSIFLDSSSSGDDVFFLSHQELTGAGQGEAASVYDARVNAVVPPAGVTPCEGENCRGPSTKPTELPGSGSAQLDAPERVVVSPKSKTVKGNKTELRVSVPSGGKLSISGKGIKQASKSPSARGFVTVIVALKPASDKARRKKGVFATKADIEFFPSAGDSSSTSVSLRFKSAAKKGGK